MYPRRLLWSAAVLVLVLAAVAAGIAVGGKGKSNDKNFEYAIALWGDLPYSAAQENVGLPNLIADVNDADVKFSVHDGDLKAGNGVTANPPSVNCDDALYARALGWFNSFEKPAIFTPGDNDWTDCDRATNGGYNSTERLDHERQVFFSTDRSLGRHTLKMEVQGGPPQPQCLGVAGLTPCVENRRWELHDVMYVTVNVPGSCNNRCDAAPNEAEYVARNAAVNAWLRESFAAATERGDVAIMIITQVNPGFDASDGTRTLTRDAMTLVSTDTRPGNVPDGYFDFVTTLRNETIAFRKPVAYVHGDSHYFRIDKPLLDATGKRLENFTRVETFGNNPQNGVNDVHWLKALVDPKSRDVFAFQPQIIPGNRVAVPAS